MLKLYFSSSFTNQDRILCFISMILQEKADLWEPEPEPAACRFKGGPVYRMFGLVSAETS